MAGNEATVRSGAEDLASSVGSKQMKLKISQSEQGQKRNAAQLENAKQTASKKMKPFPDASELRLLDQTLQNNVTNTQAKLLKLEEAKKKRDEENAQKLLVREAERKKAAEKKAAEEKKTAEDKANEYLDDAREKIERLEREERWVKKMKIWIRKEHHLRPVFGQINQIN